MTTFTSWLKQQSKRDDPIGDLASDYIRAGRLPNSEEMSRSYIKEAMDEARKEYKEAI